MSHSTHIGLNEPPSRARFSDDFTPRPFAAPTSGVGNIRTTSLRLLLTWLSDRSVSGFLPPPVPSDALGDGHIFA
jgi:hypothetical protein